MTDLTRTFIAVADDEADARSFAETVATGSDAAIRAAREDASDIATMTPRFPLAAPLLWAAMRNDMQAVIDKARAQRGYCDMADMARAGYWQDTVEAYLRALKPAPDMAEGDAA